MTRRFRSLLFVLPALVALVRAPARADALSVDQAVALVSRPLWSVDKLPAVADVEAAKKVLEAQMAKEPSNAQWTYAAGRASALQADLTRGDGSKPLHKEALERFQKAAGMDPNKAEYQFWFANACFDRVDDVNMFSQMSLASDGKKAFEKAIALDPSYVEPHVGLAQFFLQAPSIAGGSVDKAKAQGEALLAIPDHKGEFQGRLVLGGIAAQQEHWDEMSKQYTLAESAGGAGADPVTALRTHAWQLLNKKKDAKAAEPVVERYLKVARPDDYTARFLDAEVKRVTGRCADALPRYDEILAKVDGARGSRWGAAVCHDTLGQKDAAKREYEEYVKRFPDDARTKEAKAALKRLAGS